MRTSPKSRDFQVRASLNPTSLVYLYMMFSAIGSYLEILGCNQSSNSILNQCIWLLLCHRYKIK